MQSFEFHSVEKRKQRLRERMRRKAAAEKMERRLDRILGSVYNLDGVNIKKDEGSFQGEEAERKISQISSYGTTHSTVFRRTKRGTERLVSFRPVPSRPTYQTSGRNGTERDGTRRDGTEREQRCHWMETRRKKKET
ncbi:hypothetical protein DVH24_018994 [Malus domestica]|uniref:Uncharacterized protein n=1 Tax=Malus domestica TaxID=3750 RepID=A0A498HXC2_MALDO|nr:hypothetical protein DVH24_018994 [Malus domestica]